MIDWAKIQDPLREWFCEASGLATYWFGEEVENVDNPYCELQVGASRGLGVDESRQTYDGTQAAGKEVVRSQYGNRLFMLSCRAQTRDHRPNYAARFYLEKVRTALYKRTSLAVFGAADLALVEALPLVNLDRVFQDRQNSRAMLDIRFATIATEVDPHEKGGYIDKTEITSDLRDAGGTSLPSNLQLIEEEIP